MKKIFISLLVATFFVPSIIFALEGDEQITTTSLEIQPIMEQNSEVKAEPMLISEPKPGLRPEPRLGQGVPAQNFEKISSPDQIKNYKNIKKEGNALFGIRIEKIENKIQGLADKAKEALNKGLKPAINPIKNASTTMANKAVKAEAKELEKISSPKELSLFEKIKQVGNALWGYRKADKDSSRENLGATLLTSDNISCLKTAIDKKDTAISSALTAQNTALVSAVAARGTCQKSALDLSVNSEAIKAFKSCKDVFNKAINDSRMFNNKSRDEAWKTYQQEVKACYKPATISTSTSSVKENNEVGNILLDDGGNNLQQ